MKSLVHIRLMENKVSPVVHAKVGDGRNHTNNLRNVASVTAYVFVFKYNSNINDNSNNFYTLLMRLMFR